MPKEDQLLAAVSTSRERWLWLLHAVRLRQRTKRIRKRWRTTSAWLRALVTTPGRIAFVVALLVAAYIVVSAFLNHPTTIDDISMPKDFADRGYTSTVEAERLRDAISSIEDEAKTFYENARVSTSRPSNLPAGNVTSSTTLPSVFLTNVVPFSPVTSTAEGFASSHDLAQERINFTVPVLGFSTESIYSLASGLLHAHRISGEIVVLPDKNLSLTLREDGKSIGRPIVDHDSETILRTAAKAVLELEHPSIVIAALSQNPQDAIHEATSMIARFKPDNPEGERLRLLRGDLLLNEGDYAGAVLDYEFVKAAMKAANKDEVPALTGVANALYSEGKLDDAMAAYRRSINANPNYAPAYNGLGNVLRDQGKRGEAVVEYRAAIARDSRYALPHNGLGNVLADEGQFYEAIAEYHVAIELDTHYAAPHHGLGNLLAVVPSPQPNGGSRCLVWV